MQLLAKPEANYYQAAIRIESTGKSTGLVDPLETTATPFAPSFFSAVNPTQAGGASVSF